MPPPTPERGPAPTAGRGKRSEPGAIAGGHGRQQATDTHDCAALPHRTLFALLRVDDLDGAIACGLAGFQPCAICAARQDGYDIDAREALTRRDQLQAAWAARDRHLARQARLARRAAERAGRRAAVSTPAGTPAALPPSAAAALARAKARVAARGTS